MQQQSNNILSVTQLNREAKYLLESSFPLIWVEGEISNLAQPGSGHIYFSLKDEKAQVRCAMFRNRNMRIKFRPRNGQKVMIQARVSLFEGRGEFQLIAEQMQEAGLGDLHKKFEQLKRNLESEGLFSADRKKAIPAYPESIGIITSPTGAAIRDILSVLKRRYPLAKVFIYPTLVQGETAAAEICKAIEKADADKKSDLLLLTRGGGSIEDLWCFNEEIVARKVFSCQTPIVSGVGHEIDFTICDFVADLRAPTPSAAAELVTPDINELAYKVDRLELKAKQLVTANLKNFESKLNLAAQKLEQQKPSNKIENNKRYIEHIRQKLEHMITFKISNYRQAVSLAEEKVKNNSPSIKIANLQTKVETLQARLENSIKNNIEFKQQKIESLARNLNAVSPLQTISRGYSVLESTDKHVVTSTSQVNTGDIITAKVSDGELECQVTKVITLGDNL